MDKKSPAVPPAGSENPFSATSIPYGDAMSQVLSRLSGVKKTQSGYIASCPAHEDTHPSLSIREAEDGRVLLHCWTGCRTQDVVAAIGLTMADLFPARPTGPRRRRTKAERQQAARRQVETALERRFKQAEADVSRDLADMIRETRRLLYLGGWWRIINDSPSADDLAALAHRIDYWEYLADELLSRDTGADTKIAAFLAAKKEVAAWANVALKYSSN